MRCDSHVHIVGPAHNYPQVPERTYLAGVASVETLKRLGAARGITRFVIVQPSFYGSDNSALLDSLDALGERGRGVAVIKPETSDHSMLQDYAIRGVRGLRINLYSQLGGPDKLQGIFAANARVAQEMKWHVEVIAPLPAILDSADVVARSPVAVVIDHYGLHGRLRPESASGRRFLELLRLPHVWMKQSAPYRNCDNPMETHPDPEWLAAILAMAAERCVWGSDWPFTAAHDQHRGPMIIAPYRDLSYESVVDDFLAALPSPDLVDALMAKNPARLYGF
jgi:predicted TIM-barrel fold metal-dependent hydrolase